MKKNQKIMRLDWDSDFFGIEVGSLLNKDEKLSLSNASFDLIYIHSENELLTTTIPCYDKKVTFVKTISNDHKNLTPAVKEYKGGLTKELVDLAIASGLYSRFKLDPKLSHRFEELYTLWIQNSLNGKLADYVFVYEKNDEIIGFVTLKKKDGFHQIGLIATSERHREMGIGTALLQKIEEVTLQNNQNQIKIISQFDNLTAYKFYIKNGYKVDSLEYIYHLWL